MATDDEPEYILCVPVSDPLMMPDNVTKPCTVCGQLVQLRKHSAALPKSCKVICIRCAVEIIPADAQPMITDDTYRDLLKHYRKRFGFPRDN